ncbi:MAG: PAS domain S-box protein, partial [Actinomycetota bacterium]
MPSPNASWSTQQLTEFLAAVSSFASEEAAERGGVERVAEALEAEVAVLARDGSIVASVGFPAGKLPEADLLALLESPDRTLFVPGAGSCPAMVARVEDDPRSYVVVARSGEEDFSHEERDLLRGMGRILSLTLQTLRALAASRHAAIEAERARADAVKGAILESALDCVITADREGRIVDFNPAAEKTFGYRRDDVVGKNLAETIIPPALRKTYNAGMMKFMTTGEGALLGKRVEMAALHADGSEFPVEVAITAIENDGHLLFAAYLRDISERRKMEDALRKSEELFRSAFEHTATGMVLLDTEGRYVAVNEAFCNMVGYSRAELLGTSFEMVTHEDDDDSVSLFKKAIRADSDFVHLTKRYKRKGGQTVWAEVSATVLRDESGKPIQLVNQIQDISARRLAEEEMETSMSLLQATLESTADGILVVDDRGSIVGFNQKFMDMWNISESIMVAKDDEKALNHILDQLKD